MQNEQLEETTINDELRFFTVLLLTLACCSSLISIVILPEFIVGPLHPEGIAIPRIADVWRPYFHALPSMTKLLIRFGDAYLLRYILTVIITLAAIALEIKYKNRKLAGCIHAAILLLSIILSYFIFISALLPLMPA